MNRDEQFLKRCIDLARLGGIAVAPNPMVGAVLVYNERIIGEGYHQKYGAAHAEVNAIGQVKPIDQKYLSAATLYLSLEPCSHHGKTPPCVDLIIKHKIPRVVIACQDPNPLVAGNGIKRLKAAGIEIEIGVLATEGKKLIQAFDCFQTQKRPKVILKFAQSQDGFLGKEDGPVWLTNPFSKRLVHKWRSEVDAIMIGTNTARIDNPHLNTRFHFSPSPLRVVLDRQRRLDLQANVFQGDAKTLLVASQFTAFEKESLGFEALQLPFDQDLLPNLLSHLHQKKYTQLLVEGGAQLLNSFLAKGLWDEARVFNSPKRLESGIVSPRLAPEHLVEKIQILEDQLFVYQNPSV